MSWPSSGRAAILKLGRCFSPPWCQGRLVPTTPWWDRLLLLLENWCWHESHRGRVDPENKSYSLTYKVDDTRVVKLVALLREVLRVPFSRITINMSTVALFRSILFHDDLGNVGPALLAVLGHFAGGVTVWADGATNRCRRRWIRSNGHVPHGTTPTTSGRRFSIIVYTLKGDVGGASSR